MSDYSVPTLNAAHRHSNNHRAELESSAECACFFCRQTVVISHIEEWIDEDDTALCPHCGVDSVLGAASGYPVTDRNFLDAMHFR